MLGGHAGPDATSSSLRGVFAAPFVPPRARMCRGFEFISVILSVSGGVDVETTSGLHN